VDDSLKKSGEDSLAVIHQAFENIKKGTINYTTFSAKVNVDYQGTDGKKYDVNANLRMYKDSVIWISITALRKESCMLLRHPLRRYRGRKPFCVRHTAVFSSGGDESLGQKCPCRAAVLLTAALETKLFPLQWQTRCGKE
jgi:hypothetical protein